MTLVGAKLGATIAGAAENVRLHTGKGLISQGGVSLGLLLLVEPLPGVGPPVVALGMTVVLVNILVGPVVLRSALTGERTDAQGALVEGAPARNRSPLVHRAAPLKDVLAGSVSPCEGSAVDRAGAPGVAFND